MPNHEFVVVIKLTVASSSHQPKPTLLDIRRAFGFWLDGDGEALVNPLTGLRLLNSYGCHPQTGSPRSEVLRIIERPDATPSV